VKGFATDCVRLARIDNPFLVVEMRFAFRAGDEPSANCHALGPKSKGRRETTPVDDSAGRKDGCGGYGFDNGGEQRK
jgi:hypothetical protein